MEFFQYLAPTKVIFGRGTEARTGALCKEAGATKVLIHYGGHSAKKSGLIDRICASLQAEGISYTELGGVVPNPRLSKVYEGIELGRKEKIDFILAVGGGSVIDSAKAIGYGLTNEGDVWDYYTGKAPQACMPIGAVLTIAAAGSEMSNASIITNENGWLKRGAYSPYAYCKFAVMNPELTYTLPAYQTASGCTDIIVHSLERFFTKPDVKQLNLTDGIAETLKYGVIGDASLFAETASGDFKEKLEEIIETCVKMKRDIVNEDEFDTGLRQLLNLGHTLGHSIEKNSNFTLSHGHAVAIGMHLIAKVAERRGLAEKGLAETIRQALLHNNLPTSTSYTAEEIAAGVLKDKKRRGGEISFILPTKIGHCEIVKIPTEEVLDLVRTALA